MTVEMLAALADAWGIEREFLDYKKDPVQISFAARTRVLSLMRRAPIDDRELGKELDAATWSRPLMPCIVSVSGQPLTFTARLPASAFTVDTLQARITLEDGTFLENRVTVGATALRSHAVDHGTTLEEHELSLVASIPEGYHRMALYDGQAKLAECYLYQTPAHAFRPDALCQGQRLFGLSVQLYTVRSERNWGMGDFTDLCELIRLAAAEGMQVIGVNPLHALFPANPLHFSPYSPSNRSFLNALYIDPLLTPEYSCCAEAQHLVQSTEFQARLTALRASHHVDYAGVAAQKWSVLERLFRHFRDKELAQDTARAQAFFAFCESQGNALQLHAIYDALHEYFLRQDMACWGWPVWPEAYRDPESEAVSDFAREHAERVQYFCYLQWIAREQLLAAQAMARSLGMSVGIYLDLAVGVDMNGSEVWANQDAFALQASAGAPPDELARSGQDWGFPPLCPRNLERTGYALFARNLRSNMALCGAVRYDHAVSLLRLWWIPKNLSAADGAYVRYSLDSMLGIIALESQRHGCLVIGEDLGTVPDLLTQRMEQRHIFSYRVLYFEKTAKRLNRTDEYPQEAAATITTHDLPTLASWWDGSDIELRAQLGLLGTDAIAEQMLRERAVDRDHLLQALHESGCWDGVLEAAAIPALTDELNAAVHRFLARSGAGVMITQLEDLMGMLTPVNVPGTFKEHLNWQRKLRYSLEGLFERPAVKAVCEAMREERST